MIARALGILLLPILAVSLGMSGCTTAQEPGTDGQSHWLVGCSELDPCAAGLTCFCGRCTSTCGASNECSGQDSMCDEAAAGCDEAPSGPGLCTQRCSEDADCPGDLHCQDRRCMLDGATPSDRLSSFEPESSSTDAGVASANAVSVDASVPSQDECHSGFVLQIPSGALAERLAQGLYTSPADDDFVQRVEEATLDTSGAVGCFVEQLLNEPEARAGVEAFYSNWLDLDRAASPDVNAFPEYTVDTLSALRAEALRFTAAVTLEEAGSLRTLLTAQFGFANAASAAVYGVDVSGAQLQRLDWAGSGRFGVFGQGFFLSTRASPLLSSPTQRGLTVVESLMCLQVPPPPPGVNTTVPISTQDTTTRELYDQHMQEPACVGCHGVFEPMGLAFESFDAIGRYRTEEWGLPVDTSGETAPDGETLTFADSGELMLALSQSPSVRQCFARHWLEYLVARELGSEELLFADRVAERAELDGELSLVRVIVRSAESELFLSE